MDINDRPEKKEHTSGLLSLEASICLSLFIFLMLMMYSLLVVFEARNEIAHVLLTTADSLALDSFTNDTLGDEKSLQGIIYGVYGLMAQTDGTFTETSKWYEKADEYADQKEIDEKQTNLINVVKNRFVSYLAGGEVKKADEVLKRLHVINGLEGIDFSKCEIDGKDIYLEISYSLDYEFNVFDLLSEREFKQSCCSKLWNGA